MLLQIDHAITYRYSKRVYLEPHAVRLRPLSNASQRLLSFQLSVDPKPTVLAEVDDLDGTTLAYAWFGDRTDTLVVRARSEVETLRTNPFDYLMLTPAADRLPMKYDEPLRSALAPYLTHTASGDEVSRLVGELVETAQGDTIRFLSALNDRIYADYETILREEGPPWAPEVTLRELRGACRDLSVLFMEACRFAGIAARFVSGYQHADEATEHELHAWVEVYLPGGGWRGYDPTLGLAVTDYHVAIAASFNASATLPVTGTFRRTNASADMEAQVDITALPASVAHP